VIEMGNYPEGICWNCKNVTELKKKCPFCQDEESVCPDCAKIEAYNKLSEEE
jgi:hypothetical protein